MVPAAPAKRRRGGESILAAGQTAIEARNVTKTFRGAGQDTVVALDDVSVTIRENEFFTLLGPSGCGKTTLLRLIAGFDFPTEGGILLHGEDIAPLPPYKRPVNTVFQSYALFPHMTVAQNIGFGLKRGWFNPPRRLNGQHDARVQQWIDTFELDAVAANYPTQISGGQRQRVALARALIAEIRKGGVASRTTIQSFDWRTLQVVQKEAPEIATVYLTLARGGGDREHEADVNLGQDAVRDPQHFAE